MPGASTSQSNRRIGVAILACAFLASLLLASPGAAWAARGGDEPATGGTQSDSAPAGAVHDDDGANGPTRGRYSDGLVWPVPQGPIFGPFGENRGDRFHAGLDIAKPLGTAIRAAAGGRVLLAGSSGQYGLYTCIAHRSLTSCYAHQSQILTRVGAFVAQTQMIGRVGSTGNSSGPHLHFEVRQGDQASGTPLDPAAYLPGGASLAHAAAYRGPLDAD